MSQGPAPALDHGEVTRRFQDSSRVLKIYGYLHLRPGSTLEQICENLNLANEDALDSLRDLWWGGWILADENFGFYPVPVFPFAPLLFWLRQLSDT